MGTRNTGTSERNDYAELIQTHFVGADLSTVPEASTAQNGATRLELISFTISSDNLPPSSSTAETHTPENYSEIAKKQLDALKSGVKDLNDWCEIGKQALLDRLKSSGLAQHIQEGVVSTVFAKTPEIIQRLDATMQKIERIFEDTQTFSATEKTLASYTQLRSTFDGDLSQLKELVGHVTRKFESCPDASTPGERIKSIIDRLKTLDESPLIKPQEKEVVKLEDPFEQQFAMVDYVDSKIFYSETAIAPPVDWRELQAHSELARRDRKFGTIVESSKEQALPLDRKLRNLDNWSIAEHLAAKFGEQVSAVEAATTKQKEDRRTEIVELQQAIKDQEKELEPLREKWLSLANDCLELEQAVDQQNTTIDEASAVSTGSDSIQGQVSKPTGLAGRAMSVLRMFFTSNKSDKSDPRASNKTNQEAQLTNIESQGQTLSNPEEQLENKARELREIEEKINPLAAAINLNNYRIASLNSALEAPDQHSPESPPNNDQVKLQSALRDTCQGLHFKNPQDPSDPIVRALLDVSIPKTKEPIPSFDSIRTQLLAVGFVEVDGGISCIHQATGVKLTIKRRAEHGLDATLTISEANGRTKVSDRIWNHNLEAVVQHFLLKGDAPVTQAVQDEWQVPTQDQQTQDATSVDERVKYVGLGLHSRLIDLNINGALSLVTSDGPTFTVTRRDVDAYDLETATKTQSNTTTRTTEHARNAAEVIRKMLGEENVALEQLYECLGCRIPHNRTQYDPTYRTPVLQ